MCILDKIRFAVRRSQRQAAECTKTYMSGEPSEQYSHRLKFDKYIRGFSLLEVMLALVVVGIGISLVLTFSASSRQETSSQAGGNDYSVITNDILQRLVQAVETCNKNIPNGSCPVQIQFANTKTMTAYDYLCGNTTNSTGTNLPSCSNGEISNTQYTTLKNAGLDLLSTTVELKPSKSDI